MASGYKIGGVDLDTLLAPYITGASTASNTGFLVGGVDVANRYNLSPTAYGTTSFKNGSSVDIGTIFASLGNSTSFYEVYTSHSYSSYYRTVPNGATHAQIWAMGAGGSGGVVNSVYAGTGGGAGGYIITPKFAVTSGAQFTVTVGQGGVGSSFAPGGPTQVTNYGGGGGFLSVNVNAPGGNIGGSPTYTSPTPGSGVSATPTGPAGSTVAAGASSPSGNSNGVGGNGATSQIFTLASVTYGGTGGAGGAVGANGSTAVHAGAGGGAAGESATAIGGSGADGLIFIQWYS